MTEATTPTEVTTSIDTTAAQTDPILGAVPGAKEDVTTSLYRAAIGPMCADFYLPIFSRFEAAGKPGLSWNSAASLLTFNWLLFRQLWTAALAYVGILAAVGLLVFGIGRLVFQMSDEVSLVLALLFGLAAFVAPGLLGNVLLHKQCRARMEQALADNPTVTEATSQLQRQASSRLRLLWLALGNAGVLGLAALVYLQVSALATMSAMPQGAAEARQTVSGLATDASSALTGASTAAALTPASAPVLPAASAPAAVASEPIRAASAETAAAVAPAPVAHAILAAQTAAATPPADIQLGSKGAKSKITAAPETSKAAATATAAPATSPPTAATQSSKAVADAPMPALFYINVGLFSKPENASRVHAQLLEASMPSVMKELQTTKARQIRVRVGPYATEEKAEAAAQKIKAMQFETGIIQK